MAIFNKIDSALAWRILTKSIRPWHGDFCKQGQGPIGPKGQGVLAIGPIRAQGQGGLAIGPIRALGPRASGPLFFKLRVLHSLWSPLGKWLRYI